MIVINGKTYELLQEHKNAWNAEAFKERYSEILERYDYIVGDWGYGQLRLKGFFREASPRASKDSMISGLQDYLQEYCNFGCAYFILERKQSKQAAPPESEARADGADEPTAFGEADGTPSAKEDPGASGEPSPYIAGGKAFSDRRPYSWREHQGPVRQAAVRLAASGGAESERSGETTQSANSRSERGRTGDNQWKQRGERSRGDQRYSGGASEQTVGQRRNDQRDRANVQALPNDSGGQGQEEKSPKQHRKFRGPRHGNRTRGQAGGGPRTEADRPLEGRGGGKAPQGNRGPNDRFQQRQHHKPSSSPSNN